MLMHLCLIISSMHVIIVVFLTDCVCASVDPDCYPLNCLDNELGQLILIDSKKVRACSFF